MQHIRSIKKIGLTILTALLATSAAIAQDAAPAAKTVVSNNNQLETLLIVIMGLLVFVIWLLGRVLLVLGKQVVEKNKVPKVLPVLLMAALLFAAQTTSAQNAAPAETVKVISNYGGLSSGTFYLLLSVLATEIIIILFFTSLIRRFSAELLP